MSENRPKRPPLGQRLLEAMQRTEEWACGERSAQTIEKVDGKRVIREETGPQFMARRAREQRQQEQSETEEAA